MSEFVLNFGPQGGLVGTLCIPGDTAPQPLAVVLLNAGVIPRMGPHRFNVKLARALAQAGISSMRLDLSGQGDSEAATQRSHHEDLALADLQAAMDEVSARTGITRFVIAGICSGAINGLAVAQQDPRVVGLWMLDGYAYPGRWTAWWRILRQLRFQFKATLRAWLTRVWEAVSPRAAAAEAEVIDYGLRKPSQTEFAQILQTLVDRRVQVYLVYTLDKLWSYSYAGQFRDVFRRHAFVSQVTCEHRPDIDHTVTRLSAQREVIGQIVTWAGRIAPDRD